MMTTPVLSCSTILLALGVVLAPTASRAQTPSPKPETGAVASVTVTGCLERWSAAKPDGASDPAADAPPAGAEYMLTSQDPDPASRAAASGPESKKRYLLLDNPKVDYAAHLRHTVTVVGTITPQPTPGASAEDRAIDPSTRETNLPLRPEPAAYRLNLVEVSSLKMVSNECRP